MTKKEAPGLANTGATNKGKVSDTEMPNNSHFSTENQPTKAAALVYAAHGLPIFPCGWDKRPKTKNGFRDATTDTAQIEAWWTADPLAMIGMPTGEASGVWCLDVDMHEGQADGFFSLAALDAQHEPLPAATRTHETPSGGRHLLFRYPADRDIRNSASKLGPGLDVRGEGGYIIVPPSATASGKHYIILDASRPVAAPEWLLDLVAPPLKSDHRVNRPPIPPSQPRGTLHPYVARAVDAELATLASTPEG
ncbi:MAG: bifunctional DNA primase/polymerase [Desulfobulbaceae bacterium]|jgi:putative DNA primase/helicase|nr:bifunctional DNA primase/polymerase [Desulfobulbaceae bacterium]